MLPGTNVVLQSSTSCSCTYLAYGHERDRRVLLRRPSAARPRPLPPIIPPARDPADPSRALHVRRSCAVRTSTSMRLRLVCIVTCGIVNVVVLYCILYCLRFVVPSSSTVVRGPRVPPRRLPSPACSRPRRETCRAPAVWTWRPLPAGWSACAWRTQILMMLMCWA